MPDQKPLTILCVTSYEKGQEFIRTCKAMGCRVLLLTVDKLKDGDWPRECLDGTFTMPEDLPLQGLIYSVSYIARSQRLIASWRSTNSIWRMFPRCESICASRAWG